MSPRTRRGLQVAVVLVGCFLFVANLFDGVGVWDFVPLGAMACLLVAIDQARRDHGRNL